VAKIVGLVGLFFSFLGLGHAAVKQIRGPGQNAVVSADPIPPTDNG